MKRHAMHPFVAAALACGSSLAQNSSTEEPAMPVPAAPAVTYVASPAFQGEFYLIRALDREGRFYTPRPEDLERFLQWKPAD